MSDDLRDFTHLRLFVPMTEQQSASLLDAHTSITQGPVEGTGLVLPKTFDNYVDIPLGVDLTPGTVDGEHGLWIKDSFGDANVGYVGDLLQHHVQMSPEQTPLGFQYADRTIGTDTGDYGGGAVVVTAQEIRCMTTSGWIDETLTEINTTKAGV